MQVNRVGHSGFFASELTLGAFDWGRGVAAGTAQELVDGYARAGGTLIEIPAFQSPAAEVLGSLTIPKGVGIAARIGIAGRGDDVRISAGRATLLDQASQVLDRLGRDALDLVILDAFDPVTPLAETAGALTRLVESGRAHYAAAAHCTGWQLAALCGAGAPLVAAWAEASLLARDAEAELAPAAEYLGLGVFAGAALGRGVLTGKYDSGTPQNSRAAGAARAYVEPYLEDGPGQVVAGAARAASALGASPLDVALAWNRSMGWASSAVAPRTPAQLEEILASELVLEPEIRDALDQISAPDGLV
ncbi:aldo/keto reductase [Brevibacterium sp. 5221]|uniref:Aldo/keto reductase n=1 Tax=Brevibacterium rongguiense TaxID=2695267 RepID=A0A6N9H4X8_9MICO|nr:MULTISPECIES: aldo/keto reductase [Brevibacterium]MYM18943.1 aldo/keto reductase [Brevibacterium rongguiense]WAL40791.1 aldo/keto reductase [Brevibacterium sp. BRM-1]